MGHSRPLSEQDNGCSAPSVHPWPRRPGSQHHAPGQVRRLLLSSKIKSARSRSVGFLGQSRCSCLFSFELKIMMAGPSRGPTAHARVALYRAASEAARPSPDNAGLGPCGSRSLPRSHVARPPETTRILTCSSDAQTRLCGCALTGEDLLEVGTELRCISRDRSPLPSAPGRAFPSLG